jgi:hypothetical protein
LRAKAPDAPIYVHFLGYDDDPRELHEFADVRHYVRWWARAAGLADFDSAFTAVGDQVRFPCLLGILCACGAYGPEIASPAAAQLKPHQQQ